jgi:methylmalonyl-CoA/ethylmalonyl-CoA epimerase
MPAKLDHIGVAVENVSSLGRLFALLGLGIDHAEDVASEGVRAHFIPLPAEGAHLELLEVTNPEGTVARFIAKRGPGVHHLSFRLSKGELEPICARLRAEGIRLVYDQPRPGAHSMRINFVHPASAGGLLLELMEPA